MYSQVFYFLLYDFQKKQSKNAEVVLDALLKFPLPIIDADLKLSLEAARLKAKYSLSYADAFAAALTIQKKAVLLTGDEEFDNLKSESGFKVQYL